MVGVFLDNLLVRMLFVPAALCPVLAQRAAAVALLLVVALLLHVVHDCLMLTEQRCAFLSRQRNSTGNRN